MRISAVQNSTVEQQHFFTIVLTPQLAYKFRNCGFLFLCSVQK